MWPDLLENYTTSRSLRGAGDGWLFRLRMGFLWAGRCGSPLAFEESNQESNSDGFMRLKARPTTPFATSAA